MTDATAIAHNRRAHDAIGEGYDARHPEIYNDVEQARLAEVARRAVALAGAGGRRVRALDVGCGTGNLTAHLIAAGATVTAADLSSAFLDVVRARFGGRGLESVVALNGTDLRPVPDGAFDLVATYSVLHHVPDYTAFVRDMARVTAPGGLVLIDHERSSASWTSPAYATFLREAVAAPPPRRWWYWFQPSRYWKRARPMLE
ncbi:MAG TPA: class I SAM-dependent methyltransferase, partial [Gemmatimonadaceae bacterium]|nr:class I SAM-dependent methyltransferase [Gemmatimonadaceae bacterium]